MNTETPGEGAPPPEEPGAASEEAGTPGPAAPVPGVAAPGMPLPGAPVVGGPGLGGPGAGMPGGPAIPPGGGMGWGSMPPGSMQPVDKAGGLAIAALVLSLVGLIPCFFGIPNILAIVFGAIELSHIKKGDASRKGYGMALAGLIIGLVTVGLFVLLIILEIIIGITTGFE